MRLRDPWPLNLTGWQWKGESVWLVSESSTQGVSALVVGRCGAARLASSTEAVFLTAQRRARAHGDSTSAKTHANISVDVFSATKDGFATLLFVCLLSECNHDGQCSGSAKHLMSESHMLERLLCVVSNY